MSLEADLQELSTYGKTFLFTSDSGWSCSCELSNTPMGIKVDVTARGHASPTMAASECLQRLHAMKPSKSEKVIAITR